MQSLDLKEVLPLFSLFDTAVGNIGILTSLSLSEAFLDVQTASFFQLHLC